MNNEFEKWFSSFSENSENLTSKTLKEMLESAYKAGFIQCEMETPLYAKRDDGIIVEVPREQNESILPKGENFISEDFDVDAWIEEKRKNKEEVDASK